MDNLRQLQMVELDILKKFIKICEANNLQYFAIGGTALGAVRHKGFIPWDDDIDVAMPREDYEKFIEITTKRIKYPYEIETIDNNKDHLCPFMQIVDRRVELFLALSKKGMKQNAWIDVFPLDGLPDSKIARAFHTRIGLFKRTLFLITQYETLVQQNRKRPAHERLMMWFCNKVDIQHLFDKKKRHAKSEELFKKYSFYKSKYCWSPWSTYKLKAIYPVAWFQDGIKLPFEDIEIVNIADYDKFLTHLFDDYMTLPPLEEQVNHHGLKIIHIEK